MLWLKKNFKKSIDKRVAARLNGRSFQIQAKAWDLEKLFNRLKILFRKKINFFEKKALTTEREFALIGGLFKFKRTTFETLGSGAEFRRRSSGKNKFFEIY